MDVSGQRSDPGAGGHAGRCGRGVRAGRQGRLSLVGIDVCDSSQGGGCLPCGDVHAATKGPINPYLLVAADIAGVTEIYRVGGVQAVGAMAYGTKTIQRVDKIVGPGNIYVATAKRLLYGTVGIDMVAGPSELLVVADGDAKPAHVAADLLCEAEHDEDAQVYLVTTSAQLAKDVVQLIGSQLKGLQREKIAAKSIARHSVAFVVATMDEAIDVANEIAPEHLTLSVDEPFDYLEKIRHAGALFLGRYTPRRLRITSPARITSCRPAGRRAFFGTLRPRLHQGEQHRALYARGVEQGERSSRSVGPH